MSKQLRRIVETDPRFEEYSDETCPVPPGTPADEHCLHHDGHWLYTSPGWINAHSETHCIHEWTVKDVLEEYRSGCIVPCACEDRCRAYWQSLV